MMAVAIWGSKANGGTYAAIAALTNILTACLSLVVYETLFADSSRGTEPLNVLPEIQIYLHPPLSLFLAVVHPGHHLHLRAREAETEYRAGKTPSTNIPELDDSTDKVAVAA